MKKPLIILIMTFFILTALSACVNKSAITNDTNKIVTKDSLNDTLISVTDFTLVEENEILALYVKGNTAEIMVEDKSTKTRWYSNPQDRQEDSIAAATEKELLSSQISIKYYDKTDNLSLMNSSTDCVSLGQYTFAKITNGVRITYTIGKEQKIILAPKIIEKSRMAQFASKMDSEQKKYVGDRYLPKTINGVDDNTKKELLDTYPSLINSDLYVLTSDYPEFIMKKLETAFVSAGYTEADLIKDNTDNQIETNSKPIGFVIPVDYTLDGENFDAKISANSIVIQNNEVKLTDISLLQFFGAASLKDSGYLFVPDGSGAIINFNNDKTQFDPYYLKVYNRDMGIEMLSKPTTDEKCFLPVFGAKKNDTAYLAIIKKGDAFASINATVSKKLNSYNVVYPSFTYRNYDKVNTAVDTSSKMNVYQKSTYAGDYLVSYHFLNGSGADYSGMATAYQKYLVDNKLLTKPLNFKPSFDLTLLGTVDYNSSILGVPVTSNKKLTTYNQAIDILKLLKNKNISNITLQYKYWSNGGIKNNVFSKAELISDLGNKTEFGNLVTFTKENNIKFFPDADFVSVSLEGPFKGFIAYFDGARMISGDFSFSYDYDISTEWRNRFTKKFIISPYSYDKFTTRFIDSYKRLKINALSVNSLGTILSSDFNDGRNCIRSQSQEEVQKLLAKFNSNGFSMLSSGANAYLLAYISSLTNLPYESSNHYIIDRSIPFYQMVIHGYLPYSSIPINFASDYKYDELKALETGSNIHCEWIYENNSVLKDTDYDIFGVYYEPWLEKAVNSYLKISSALDQVSDKTIVSHSEKQKNVFATKYSNGVTIYTNFNQNEVLCNDIIIAAMDYSIKGGN